MSSTKPPHAMVTLLASLALVVALGWGEQNRASAKGAAACALKGSETLRASREVRVFEKRSADGWWVYGCSYAVGRRYKLGFKGGGFEDEVNLFAISGPHVAYVAGYHGEDFPHFHLYVKDLRTGANRHAVEEERPNKVVLHRSGAVAWTTTTCLWDQEQRLPGATKFDDDCRYVVKADAARAAVIDADLRIDLQSIRLDGRTVRWTTAGNRESYILHTARR